MNKKHKQFKIGDKVEFCGGSIFRNDSVGIIQKVGTRNNKVSYDILKLGEIFTDVYGNDVLVNIDGSKSIVERDEDCYIKIYSQTNEQWFHNLPLVTRVNHFIKSGLGINGTLYSLQLPDQPQLNSYDKDYLIQKAMDWFKSEHKE